LNENFNLLASSEKRAVSRTDVSITLIIEMTFIAQA